MLKKIQLLFAFALALPAASHAYVGGPFDNGDFNQVFDDRGVYQATLRFSNGQGFAQFGSNVDVTTYVDLTQSGGGSSGTTSSFRTSNGSFLNRSVIYYKGVTYLGTAYGTVDVGNKHVDCITNGNSDVTTTTAQGGTSTQQNLQSVASTNILIANGQKGFICNTHFAAHITTLAPILKFVGKGELSILNQDGTQQILAVLTAMQTPIATAATTFSFIATAGGTATATPLPIVPLPIPAGVPALGSPDSYAYQAGGRSLLGNLNFLVNGDPATGTPPLGQLFADATSNTASVFDAADRTPMTVYGIRKFFLSRR